MQSHYAVGNKIEENGARFMPGSPRLFIIGPTQVNRNVVQAAKLDQANFGKLDRLHYVLRKSCINEIRQRTA